MLQAIKRLMTALQRLCPTDPSRCMDFSVAGDEGRGIAGSGSNRDALLQAQVGAAARLTAALHAVVRYECACTIRVCGVGVPSCTAGLMLGMHTCLPGIQLPACKILLASPCCECSGAGDDEVAANHLTPLCCCCAGQGRDAAGAACRAAPGGARRLGEDPAQVVSGSGTIG